MRARTKLGVVTTWRAAAVVTALSACAHDAVLPDIETPAVCGNGILEVGEECDVPSAGCQSCSIVPDWTCVQASGTCTQICGDGVVSGGAGCTLPQRDTACDMTGYWAARETDYELDQVFMHTQVSSDWELYHFVQTGDDFVVDQEIDCGVHVTGSETVDYPPSTEDANLYLNRMDGMGTRPARHGTSVATAEGCNVTFDRWYAIRGGVDNLLPPDFSTLPALASLPPLPVVADPVGHPATSADAPPGTTDPDGDGIPGMAFALTGLIHATRNSVQRDYKEYASTSPVQASAIEFQVAGGFDLQESVMAVTDCGTGCALADELANVASGAPHHITLSFIGKTLGSARVGPVVVNTPRASLADDLATCANVRLILPHDGSIPPGYE